MTSLNLSGGGLSFSIPPLTGTATNITPDRETGIGSWTDDEIKRAIVAGKRPNHGRLPNTELAVVMATSFFKAMTPSDLDAVVAYLRSIPAIRNEVAAPVYRLPQRHQPFPDAEAGLSEARMNDPVYRGRYLVTIAHCMECHSPLDKGTFDFQPSWASIAKGEKLLLNVGTAKTMADVTAVKKDYLEAKLTIPICGEETDRVALSRRVDGRWRLIGPGVLTN